MTLNPESQVFKNPEYLGTFRSTRFLDQENMSRIESLLNFLYTYYQKNGIEVLTNFHDFDRSNTGAVTEAQVKNKKILFKVYFKKTIFSKSLNPSNRPTNGY